MLTTTICVQVAGTVREYPAMIAGFGDHLAAGGTVVSLEAARQEARSFFRKAGAEWTALTYWATLDSSGLAYRLEIGRGGSWAIKGAAPLPGPNNVQEVYVA